jgi:hypothetical protein
VAEVPRVSENRDKPPDVAKPETAEADTVAFEREKEALVQADRRQAFARARRDSDNAKLALMQQRLAELGPAPPRPGGTLATWTRRHVALQALAGDLQKFVDADEIKLRAAESDYRDALAGRDRAFAALDSDSADRVAIEDAEDRALSLELRKQSFDELEAARAEAPKELARDTAKLAKKEAELAVLEKPPLFEDKLDRQIRVGMVGTLRAEIPLLRAKIDADKIRVNVTESDYREALALREASSGVVKAAREYKPAGDATSLVITPVTDALRPLLDAARAQTGPQADAIVAAVTEVDYWEQAQADQQEIDRAAAKLDGLHVARDLSGNPIAVDAEGKPTNASLTPEQLDAYAGYWAAISRQNEHLAVSALSKAQLQLYASDETKYGSAAKDAVAVINKALSCVSIPIGEKKVTPQLPPVTAGDQGTAREALDRATQASALAAAARNAATSFQTFTKALLRLKEMPQDQTTTRGQANAELEQAQAGYELASNYVAKLTAARGLAIAQANFRDAGTPENGIALRQAQEGLVVAEANLLASAAAVSWTSLHTNAWTSLYAGQSPLSKEENLRIVAAKLTLDNLRWTQREPSTSWRPIYKRREPIAAKSSNF